MYEGEAPSNAMYPLQKQMGYMEPKCKFEQFEVTPFVNEIIVEFQEKAKNLPKALAENRPPLLVYWPEDKLWYYCSVRGYNQYTDKFELRYDDGVEETVHLWEEKFLTLESFNLIKHKLEAPRQSYDRNPVSMHEYINSMWYSELPEVRMKNGMNGIPYSDLTPKIPKSNNNAKDTSNVKVSKPEEKVVIDGFTIVAKEYDVSSDDSFLSDEKSFEEYEEKITFEKNLHDEQMDKKKNTFASQSGNHTMMNFSPELQALPTSKQQREAATKDASKAEYLYSKAYKDKELLYAGNHTFSLEEGSNFVIKNGPFETVKVLDAKKQSINDALAIEKEE